MVAAVHYFFKTTKCENNISAEIHRGKKSLCFSWTLLSKIWKKTPKCGCTHLVTRNLSQICPNSVPFKHFWKDFTLSWTSFGIGLPTGGHWWRSKALTHLLGRDSYWVLFLKNARAAFVPAFSFQPCWCLRSWQLRWPLLHNKYLKPI